MPRAIRAIREYPTALLLAALLFAASLVLAAGSLGYIGGGDDEGSGLGGTGRNGDFGGSGLGGTGAPNPFLGENDNDGADSDDASGRYLPPVNDPEALDRAMRNLERDAGPEMLRLQELRTAQLPDTEATVQQLRQTRELLRRSALEDQQMANRQRDEVRVEADDPMADQPVRDRIPPYSLPDSTPVETASREEDSEPADAENGDRVSPERIQRPELPPFQRMRPVQRASIAAPPPRPMRL